MLITSRRRYVYKVNGRYLTLNGGHTKDINKAVLYTDIPDWFKSGYDCGIKWTGKGEFVKVKVTREEMKDEQVS